MKTAKKFENAAEWGELAFKLLFLLNGFLQNCNLTYDKIVVSLVQWAAVGLGAILILYRAILFPRYRKTNGLWLLILFTVSYAVSTVVMIRYEWYENVRMMVFMVFQFGLLYAFDPQRSTEKTKKDFRILSLAYLICIFVLTFLGFAFLFGGYQNSIVVDGAAPVHFGFMYGRLYGAYWDVNIGAVLAAVSVPLSAFFLARKPKRLFRIFLISNTVLQIFHVAYSGSRSGSIALCCAVFLLLTFWLIRRLREKPKKTPTALIACAMAAILLITLLLPIATKRVGNLTLGLYYQIRVALSEPGEEIEELEIFREDSEVKGDVTNRRKDIWKNAVEIWTREPLFGVSRNGIIPYVKDNMPDAYILTNDYIPFYSMHNILFDVLASQGLFGLIPFVSFAVYTVVFLIRRWRNILVSPDAPYVTVWLTVFLVICVCSMVMTEIVYVISPISTVAWVCLSALVKTLSAEPIRTELPVEEKHE